jgi:hypothetical protein
MRRMERIAWEVQKSDYPAKATIPSSYTEGLDTVSGLKTLLV